MSNRKAGKGTKNNETGDLPVFSSPHESFLAASTQSFNSTSQLPSSPDEKAKRNVLGRLNASLIVAEDQRASSRIASAQSEKIYQYFNQVKEYDSTLDRVSGQGRLRGFFNDIRRKKLQSADSVVQAYQNMMERSKPALPKLDDKDLVGSTYRVILDTSSIGNKNASSSSNDARIRSYSNNPQKRKSLNPLPARRMFEPVESDPATLSAIAAAQQQRSRALSEPPKSRSGFAADLVQQVKKIEKVAEEEDSMLKQSIPADAKIKSSYSEKYSNKHQQQETPIPIASVNSTTKANIESGRQKELSRQVQSIKNPNDQSKIKNPNDQSKILTKANMVQDSVIERRPKPLVNDGRQECPHCGRYFSSDRLLVHSNVCSNQHAKSSKRSVFDSSVMRKKGTELDKPKYNK